MKPQWQTPVARIFLMSVVAPFLGLCAAVFFVCENSAWAQATTELVKPHVFDKDLRTLPPPPPETRKAHRPGTRRDYEPKPFQPGPPDPLWHPERALQPRLLQAPGPLGVTPSEFLTPSPNFDTDQAGDGPPDANGAVGPNHYIQIVNFSFEVFDKNGNRLAGPTNPEALWSGAPADDDCRVRGRGIPMSFMTSSPTAG